MSTSIQQLQSMILQSGILSEVKRQEKGGKQASEMEGQSHHRKGKGETIPTSINESNSGTTIYQSAVKFEDNDEEVEVTFNFKTNRESSSSEGAIDTSDEINTEDVLANFAGQNNAQGGINVPVAAKVVSEEERIIHEAEVAKECTLTTPGKTPTDMIKSSAVDDNYLVIGSHIDGSLQAKIINHEYVDFACLLPRERPSDWEEMGQRMEIVSKGDLTYFSPVSNRGLVGITSFSKWEQAFQIFSNIYTRVYPGHASELIQYNHIIYTAAQSFIWENVYTYDKEFRMHPGNFPQHSWAIILQQAWSMYLKDRIFQEKFPSRHNKRKKEACKHFNRGKYHEGASCKYDHRCTVPECGKFGHGAHICCKHNTEGSADKQNGGGPANKNAK